MRKIIKIKSILLISSFITLFSCYEDKGNYDYVDVNVVSIHIGEKDSTFNVISLVDTIRINPKLSATLDPNVNEDTERYSFQWNIGDEYTSKNLVYPVYIASGEHRLTLKVTDNVTKLFTEASWKMIVTDIYQRGYMILTENENKEAQLDMISVFGDTAVLKNVSKDSKMPIVKNPHRLFALDRYNNDEIYIMGDGETRKIHRTTFVYNSLTGNMKDNFIDPGLYRDFNVTDIAAASNRSGSLITVVDGDVFKAVTIGTILFDFPINRYYNKYSTFKVADRLSVNYELASNSNYNTDGFVVAYNTDEGRFTYINPKGRQLDSLADNKNDIGIFSWKPRLTFVATAHSYYGDGDNFTILKNNTGGYFIYHYNMKGSNMGYYIGVTKNGKYDISDAPGIANAKFFCFSANQPSFFYGSGSKIYGYNYLTKAKSEMDMGGEITCLYDNPKFEGGKDFIYIATYGGTPNSGKLVKKHIINNPNIIGLEDPVDAEGNAYKLEFTGLNKVIDVMYKNR